MGSSKHAIMIGMPQGAVPERAAGQGCRYRLISSCTVWGDGAKNRRANEIYIKALAAPDTINTIPDKTLEAFADHGQLKGVLPVDGGDAEATLAEFTRC